MKVRLKHVQILAESVQSPVMVCVVFALSCIARRIDIGETEPMHGPAFWYDTSCVRWSGPGQIL